MESIRLLLVEDDPNLGDILQEYLNLKAYDTTLCKDGQEGFEAFNSQSFDLCILDVMLPVMDGFTLAKKIRATDSDIPIIFLTAKGMKQDKIDGFKAGADDYITKPFSMEELQMRISAVLRRSKTNNVAPIQTEYKIGNFTFNHIQQTLDYPGEKTRKLTTKENALLLLLTQHKNKILQRSLALKQIWGNDSYFTGRSMDVFITKLRKYLRPDKDIEIINVHGKGYKMIEKNTTANLSL